MFRVLTSFERKIMINVALIINRKNDSKKNLSTQISTSRKKYKICDCNCFCHKSRQNENKNRVYRNCRFNVLRT